MEGNEHMEGEIKLGKMEVKLEKKQITGAKERKQK